MKSLDTIIRDKLVAKYLQKDIRQTQSKTSNINILLTCYIYSCIIILNFRVRYVRVLINAL